MDDPEPKRPPPPKSYVPLLILGDGPTPQLPPRPCINGKRHQPFIHTPTSYTVHNATAIISLDYTYLLCIDGGNVPPSSSPVPRPRTNSTNRSESPVPVKPERRKTKKAPSSAPAPFIAPTSIQSYRQVCVCMPPSFCG